MYQIHRRHIRIEDGEPCVLYEDILPGEYRSAPQANRRVKIFAASTAGAMMVQYHDGESVAFLEGTRLSEYVEYWRGPWISPDNPFAG